MVIPDNKLFKDFLIPKHKGTRRLLDARVEENVDIYGYTLQNLISKLNMRDPSYYIVMGNQIRSNSDGHWSDTGSVQEVKSSANEVIGTKTKFQYNHTNGPVPCKTGWFLTEYRLNRAFATKKKIADPAQYIICKVEFVANWASGASSSS